MKPYKVDLGPFLVFKTKNSLRSNPAGGLLTNLTDAEFTQCRSLEPLRWPPGLCEFILMCCVVNCIICCEKLHRLRLQKENLKNNKLIMFE